MKKKHTCHLKALCVRIPTVQIEEIGILAPTPCHRRLGLVCPFGGCRQPMPHTFGGTKPHGPWWHCGCMPAAPKQQKNAKIQKTANPKAQVEKKCKHQQPTAKTSWEHLWACPDKVWCPGSMLHVRGLAQWVPPGLMHFFGLGGISRKFPSLGGQHATLPICLPPKLGAP